ncbi:MULTISPECIES: flavin-containing monooxygenase [Amycolatopsis]|uniref:NAD(P)/FAD-dependent oxidoreductase n=1 Tax=Amycolatopsis tucumanensis TaxID=401106 RepID=A0ABP7IB37_9PSEU|nr:FAD-dependent oxidoreductase [Amycolatopsis tucumanensis]MCF6427838.1 NAD(P)-binding domain-containing protein [Amycolatopsis tucumanensis]
MRFDTVVIGGGQAGLSAGYHLARDGRRFVILDAHERIGDSWRRHWDSLRLFSPARYDGLPGMRFPAPPGSFPTRDEMADYLEAYARRFDLPVRCGTRVDRLSQEDGEFVVTAGGERFEAANVVVASGVWGVPRVPAFAGELSPEICQMHSSEYRNPSQLRPGPVLVVGASHSGADIAYEVAREHPTILSGTDTGEIPFYFESRVASVALRVLWFAATRVLTVNRSVGRKLREEVRGHGGPLIRVKKEDLRKAGVERVVDKTTGVRDGMPVLADGRVLDVANVVWCTGFRPDYGWIDLPVTGEDGYPEQERGVTPVPGLYFVGLPFLHSFSSMLVGGAGRDAEYVVRHLARRAPEVSAAGLTTLGMDHQAHGNLTEARRLYQRALRTLDR